MLTGITAIGTAVPFYRRSQQETAELVSAALHLKPSHKRLVKAIYKATGIEYRHSVLSDYCREPGEFEFFPNDPDAAFPTTAKRMKFYKDYALTLALTAIENCLNSFPTFDKNKITHVVTVSCTGLYAPGLDIEIVQQLNLKSTTKRTAINFMGCYGVFNALKVADAICQANHDASVLVVSVELCTIHFQKNLETNNIISNAIFADGAAAALIQAKPECEKYFSFDAFHCDLLPQTEKEMAWEISDSGFDIVLSSYVPEIIKSGIAAFSKKLLNGSQEAHLFAIHPGGIKILEACEEALNISAEQNKYAYKILRHYGNMSSATILFVLKALLDDLTLADHDKTVFSCAFGPGLTLESMLLKTRLTA